MANVSPSASPYAVPPIPAGSPPPTSAPPPLPPQLSAAPAPSQPKSSSSGSSSPPSPVPLAPPPGDSASPPPPQLVPSSPPPALPPSMPPTTPLPPPALPPFSPRSPVLLPITISPPSPPLQSDPLEVPPLSPPPPPRATENFPPPPPSTPPRSPQNSTPPLSQRSPPPPANPTKASPLPPPSDSPVSSAQPSRLSPPPTHSPSTSPSTAPPAPPPKQASPSPPPPASTSPQSPPSSILPDAGSPTLIRNSSEASSTVEKNSGIGTGGTLGIGIGIGIFILSFVGLVILCANRRRKKASKFSKGHIIPTSISISPASDSSVTKIPSSAPRVGSTSGSESLHSPDEPPGGYGSSRLWFTYDDLVKATNGFSAENLVGEGGFGSVYKGFLQDGREVAVKQLKVGAKQGEREFRAEVEIISRIHHRYLVSFVGYCIADNRKLLVYDYVPNNTLYFHLHGEGRPVLNWAARVKIAAGAARGLAYLHEDCHPRIIHRDIKPSNILLDHDFEARVSDFGLAKLALDAHTHITTRVMGTFGYMAPEYAISGKLTEKSDVYSFGVVLLELITGRKPVDTSHPLGDEGLVEWARPLLCRALDREEFEGLVDPRLEGNYVESEMLRMIEAAAACVRHLAAKRPRMGQIVRAFDSFLESDLTNVMRFGESEVLNSAQQSLEIQAFRRMQFRSQGSSTEYFSQATMTT